MSAGLKRAGSTALLAGAIFCGACDNSQGQADKQVRSDLEQARHLALTEPTPEASRAMLAQAAGNSDASPAARSQALAARSQSEFDTALSLMRKIDETELLLSRVGWSIIELAQQIRFSGSAVAGYQKYDPKPVKDAIEQKIADARGGPEKPAWFRHDSAAVPTLSAVNQEIARIEGELAQKNTELAAHNARRTQLIEQSEQLGVQSNALKGQEALALFTRASDLRKQAGDVSVQIDLLNNQIGRLDRGLAIAKAQQATANEVITQLQEQITHLDRSWQGLDTQAAAHRQLSAQILGTPGRELSPGESGSTIAEKATEVDRLVKEIEQLRSDAIAAATNAADFYSQAFEAAQAGANEFNQRAGENPGRPEASAWQAMATMLNPWRYRLQQAGVQRLLGELYGSQAASLASRIDVRDMVQAAVANTGMRVPASILGGDLNTERQVALTNADNAYKASEEILSTLVESSAPPELKAAGHVSRALSFYGWAQIARRAGNETLAKERVASAATERQAAFDRGATIPPMSEELGPPPKKEQPPPETPATEPSALPDGAPAPEGAPPAEGAPAPADAAPAPAEGTPAADPLAPTPAQ